MKSFIFSITFLIIFTLNLTLKVSAQNLNNNFKIFNKYDTIFWVGNTLDITSSIGKRELNPLYKNSKGEFSTPKSLTVKATFWSICKMVEYKYPEHRKSISYLKVISGGVFTVLAIRNFKIK